MDAAIGSLLTSRFHGTAPFTRVVSAARDSRAFLIGKRSATRVKKPMPTVMSTETMWSRAMSAGKSCRVATTLSHTMATLAP